jgi:hypothetical protein
MEFYVYEHWRPDTNTCFYVGKGTNRRAWVMSKRNLHHKAIQSKLIFAGLFVDVRIVISNLTEEAAYLVEKDRIAFYGRENLSNMTDGGEGGMPNPPQEIRQKISNRMKGNKWNVGKKLSEETRKKQSEAHKNKIFSDEHRRKLSENALKRPKKTLTLEHREKIRLSMLGKNSRPMPDNVRQALIEGKKKKILFKKVA